MWFSKFSFSCSYSRSWWQLTDTPSTKKLYYSVNCNHSTLAIDVFMLMLAFFGVIRVARWLYVLRLCMCFSRRLFQRKVMTQKKNKFSIGMNNIVYFNCDHLSRFQSISHHLGLFVWPVFRLSVWLYNR